MSDRRMCILHAAWAKPRRLTTSAAQRCSPADIPALLRKARLTTELCMKEFGEIEEFNRHLGYACRNLRRQQRRADRGSVNDQAKRWLVPRCNGYNLGH